VVELGHHPLGEVESLHLGVKTLFEDVILLHFLIRRL
jgi:hypothetical protein